MALNDFEFDSLTELHLTQLIEGSVPEGISIEYKRQHYGKKDEDIKEFVKDVSSFANSTGGHLIIGIEEQNSLPTKCGGVDSDGLEIETSRYENYSRDCIQPRIVGLRIRNINLASGKTAIVIRIPRSLNPPHRTTYKNSNRYYARNSMGAYELSIDELRTLFGNSQTRAEKFRAFRRSQIDKFLANETPVDLADDVGVIILHIVPFSSLDQAKQIDLEQARANSHDFAPMDSMSSYSPRINMDGFINILGGANCYGYTQVHRFGSLEAIKVRICFDRGGKKILGSVDFERTLVEAVPRYISGLEKLGMDCPIVLSATLVGVKGAVLGISAADNIYDPPDPIRQDIVFLPEIVIDSFSSRDDYVRRLKTMIDVLWNSAGRVGSKHFDAKGNWKDPGFA